MYPIFFKWGWFTINAFGTLIVVAFVVAALYARRRAARTLGLDKERVFNVCFALLFLGLAGARLLYGIVHYSDVAAKPLEIFAIWKGGLFWYGGVIAGLAWLGWYLPRHPEMKGWALVDVLALASCLGVFVGRWASFLSGDHYGKPAPDLPWAVTFSPHFEQGYMNDAIMARPLNVPLHPTQLYHSLHGLVLFAVLLLVARKNPHPGRLTGVFLMLYAIGHAVIEIWRGDDAARGMMIEGMVSTSQSLSIPIFFAGLAILLLRRPTEEVSYA